VDNRVKKDGQRQQSATGKLGREAWYALKPEEQRKGMRDSETRIEDRSQPKNHD